MTTPTPDAIEPGSVPATEAGRALRDTLAIQWCIALGQHGGVWTPSGACQNHMAEATQAILDIERQAAAAEHERVRVLTEALPNQPWVRPATADTWVCYKCHRIRVLGRPDHLGHADDCKWLAARAAIAGEGVGP